MPPRQVYGKKRTAHAGYDPNAIFGSLRCNKSSPLEVKVAEVVEEFAALNVRDENDREDGERLARTEEVLSILDGNSLPRELELGEKGRRGGRVRRKIVIDDSEEDNDSVDVTEPRTPQSPGKNISKKSTVPVRTSKALPPTDLPVEPPVPKDDIPHYSELLALSSHQLTSFENWAEQLSEHFHLTKIAEASFGEVYRLSLLQDLPGLSSSDESVLKIIALRPAQSSMPLDKRKRDALAKKMADMSSPCDVANEVKLLQRMSSIPGFTNFRDVRVVQGRPPDLFQSAYSAFNTAQKSRGKEASHFPDPKKKSSYAPDQLWAVIEMQDAGTDLEQLTEMGECTSIFSIWDVFWQVALSVAKGEEGVHFEHRDLHLGNICVRQQSTMSLDSTELKGRKLHFTPLETTIIDYTLSRAGLADGTIAFHDLATPENAGVFNADSTTEYQYDIYRYMRGAVLRDDVYADFSTEVDEASSLPEGRSWEQFHPITNLIWLHFILYKLLEHVAWPSEERPPARKSKAAHAQWKRAIDLEHILLRVQDMLDPGLLGREDGLGSVGDLVGLALSEGWLDVGDVVGEIPIGEEVSELVQLPVDANDL